MKSPKRFILDTNVLVSACILDASVSSKVLEYCISNGELLFSTQTFDELRHVLSRPKFDKYLSNVDKRLILNKCIKNSRFLTVFSDHKLCRDAEDDMFINLSIDGKASCIVTGDKDLLAVHPLGHMPILNSSQFLCYFSAFGGPLILNEPQEVYG